MIHYLLHHVRIAWCRITTGHNIVIPRSLGDGSALSVMCTRCPLQAEGE